LCQYNSQIHRVPAGRIVTNKQTSLNLFEHVWTAARANSVKPVRTCLDSSARKAAGHARARLPGKHAQGCRASARKADGQARARLYAMVQ
jgi:hypothetical protein